MTGWSFDIAGSCDPWTSGLWARELIAKGHAKLFLRIFFLFLTYTISAVSPLLSLSQPLESGRHKKNLASNCKAGACPPVLEPEARTTPFLVTPLQWRSKPRRKSPRDLSFVSVDETEVPRFLRRLQRYVELSFPLNAASHRIETVFGGIPLCSDAGITADDTSIFRLRASLDKVCWLSCETAPACNRPLPVPFLGHLPVDHSLGREVAQPPGWGNFKRRQAYSNPLVDRYHVAGEAQLIEDPLVDHAHVADGLGPISIKTCTFLGALLS